MELSAYTLSLLDDIERRIDPDVEDNYRAQWEDFWNGNITEPCFSPKRNHISKPSIEVKNIHINDCLTNLEWMLDAQLADVSGRLSSTGTALGMRANYGSGIMTSIFGAEIFEMPRESSTLPTTRSLNDSDKVREILEKGIPDFHTGFGKDVLAFGELCAEVFENYPKIKKYVEVYHPDTQGPLDIAELLWGGEMFFEMYDDPEFVHSVIRLITDTYKGFMDKWYSILPHPENDICVHWGIMQRGPILLRLDSAMNLSAEFYDEYSKPYDRELFEYYGGGCLHFCGRGDHYVPSLCEIESLNGLNLSQPELNDMDVILRTVCSKGKKIFGLAGAAQFAEKSYMKKGILHTS